MKSIVPYLRPALTASLLATTGCARPCVVTAELSRVEEAIEHPDADYIVVTASAVPELFTRHSYVVYRKGFRDGDSHERWIVPAVNPGAQIGEDRTVYLWVMPLGTRRPGSDPQAWLDELAESFDGHRLQHKLSLRGRTPERRSGTFLEAITEAERVHGLTSHPNAPVVFFP